MPPFVQTRLRGVNTTSIKFEKFPEQAREALRNYIAGAVAELESMVIGMVPRRTGKLASEIASFVDSHPDRITGRVRLLAETAAEARKAAALEYGSRGASITVKRYSRHVSMAFGHLVAPFEQIVESYTRTPNIAAGNFLRGPMEALRPGILPGMQAALAEAIAANEAMGTDT